MGTTGNLLEALRKLTNAINCMSERLEKWTQYVQEMDAKDAKASGEEWR